MADGMFENVLGQNISALWELQTSGKFYFSNTLIEYLYAPIISKLIFVQE